MKKTSGRLTLWGVALAALSCSNVSPTSPNELGEAHARDSGLGGADGSMAPDRDDTRDGLVDGPVDALTSDALTSDALAPDGPMPDVGPLPSPEAGLPPSPDVGLPSDLAVPDLAVPDLAVADLAVADLAVPDLAVADLASAAGLAAAPVDAFPPDLAAVDALPPDAAPFVPDLCDGLDEDGYGLTDEDGLCPAGQACRTGACVALFCADGNLRLGVGARADGGPLQVRAASRWYAVCADGFAEAEVRVACRQLALPFAAASAGLPAPDDGSSYVYTQTDCQGDELRLADCPHASGDESPCLSSTRATVNCVDQVVLDLCNGIDDDGDGQLDEDPGCAPGARCVQAQCRVAECVDGAVRLVGGGSPRAGRLEICHDGVFGTVCSDAFEPVDAQVVCRQLGQAAGGAVVLPDAFFGRGLGPIWLDEVACLGAEVNLLDCPHPDFGLTDCLHVRDVGLRCQPAGPLPESCNGLDDDQDGFVDDGDLCPAGLFCEQAVCVPGCNEGSARLVGGRDRFEGRVEVCHVGQWGTVCDDVWNVNNAEVVCGQLGFQNAQAIPYAESFFGQGVGPIWMDGISCNGAEARLVDCPFLGYGQHDCIHIEDAGVRCVEGGGGACFEGQLRLAGGPSPNEGRVELCHLGVWGTVCDDAWDDADANVVCQELGIPGVALAYEFAWFGEGVGDIWLDEVSCNGFEPTLLQCGHLPLGLHDCSHFEDASVSCGN